VLQRPGVRPGVPSLIGTDPTPRSASAPRRRLGRGHRGCSDAQPIAWEAWSRWKQRATTPRRHLTTGDRLLLRTLVLNLVWVTALLAWFPRASFEATCTHGDWMLEGQTGASVEMVREGLLRTATLLEFLYDAADRDPFAAWAVPDRGPRPRPAPSHDRRTEQPEGSARTPGQVPVWPMPAALHPAIAEIPTEAEESIESLAAYVGRKESDPFLQVKALHDWVADNIYYDYPALKTGIPDQGAERVFRTRRAVCAGYSRLMVALGEELGLDIRYVRGNARSQEGGISPVGHAWNAVFIEGNWYLMDVTWDSPRGIGNRKQDRPVLSEYLFTPPEFFGVKHHPKDPAWQLLVKPVTRAEFTRRPDLDPQFFAAGLTLVSPNRPHITMGRSLTVRLKNPHRAEVKVRLAGDKPGNWCGTSAEATIKMTCEAHTDGRHKLQIFQRPAGADGPYWSVGRVAVDASP
jgi:hypothetical protein